MGKISTSNQHMIISDYNISNAWHKIPQRIWLQQQHSNSSNTSTNKKKLVKRKNGALTHTHPHAYAFTLTLTLIQIVESLAHSIEAILSSSNKKKGS